MQGSISFAIRDGLLGLSVLFVLLGLRVQLFQQNSTEEFGFVFHGDTTC